MILQTKNFNNAMHGGCHHISLRNPKTQTLKMVPVLNKQAFGQLSS